jgi:translation elongation factor EF-Ts
MARLAGYTDTTVSINLDLDPSKLGDAQLLQKLEDLRLRMGVAKDITPLQIAAQDPVHKSDGQLEPITIESEAALDLALEAALESNPKQLADALVRGKKRKQKNP